MGNSICNFVLFHYALNKGRLGYIQVNQIVPKNPVRVIFDESRMFYNTSDKCFENSINNNGELGGTFLRDIIKSKDFEIDSIKKAPITAEKLKGQKILFLLSSQSDYNIVEVKTIRKFVADGGGLLLAQSTWRGRNNFSYNRIANSFGVSFANDVTLCKPQDSSSDIPPGEFSIDDIRAHDITKQVKEIHVMKSTYIEEKSKCFPLAFTGPSVWADNQWDEVNGNWGNLKKDPSEKNGRFMVMGAMEYGKGRVIFISDDIIFNNSLITMADNEILSNNIIDWLAK